MDDFLFCGFSNPFSSPFNIHNYNNNIEMPLSSNLNFGILNWDNFFHYVQDFCKTSSIEMQFIEKLIHFTNVQFVDKLEHLECQ